MQALRQRAASVARRTRPSAPQLRRTYASEGRHDHHAAPQVEEGLGTAFYVFVAAIPVSYIGYSISRPGADGSPSAFTNWLQGFEYFRGEEEARNTIRTRLLEQAAHDKHLFMTADGNRHVDLKTPELLNSGSPWNVPAGHRGRNLEEVTEHYRQQYIADEERKLAKLAAKVEKEDSSSSSSS